MSMTWKEVEEVMRPDPALVNMGKMKVDPEKCTGCGLCIENCLFRSWEMGENKVARFKEDWPCFSCYNCMVACPAGAISIVEPYRVDGGFWETLPNHRLPALMPLEPRDAEGKKDKFNTVEEIIFTRRTVRNFKDKPVPDSFVRRVIEAGRHAGTAGNTQPLQFTVITNKALIGEMNKAGYEALKGIFDAYMGDESWKDLGLAVRDDPTSASLYDPRLIIGGIGKSIVENRNPMFMGAPVVIVISADSRAVAGPQLQVGIGGEAMTLVANSLGIKASWVGFSSILNFVPELLEKLGIKAPFTVINTIVLGYPRFKQEGIVPREFRPITWFREGHDGPEIEEKPNIPEIKG